VSVNVVGVTRELHVQSPSGDLARTVELPGEIFDAQVSVPLLHQVVVAQLAAARQGTHDTKTRGEVSGGGRKPYRQKGTGRARQGSIRAPQFTGGGVVHGPTPRDYSQRTPKKMKAAALRGALSDRARGGRVHVVTGLDDGALPSTKTALRHLRRVVDSRHVLVVVERSDELTWKSLRNVPSVHLLGPGQLNTYDVLVSDDVVFTEGALAAFLAGPPKGRGVRARARRGELAALADAVSTLAPGPLDPAAPLEPTAEEPTVTQTPSDAAGEPTGLSTEPATDRGTTTAAGEGVSDEEMAEEVRAQTDPNRAVERDFAGEGEAEK
jgi:large subunit ribosomal protein L4